MTRYIKKFNTHTEYENARQNLILPNVSLCAQENEVHYNPSSPTYRKLPLADLTFVSYNNTQSRFYGKKIAICSGSQNLLPVLQMTNVNYNEVQSTYLPGRYACLMCSGSVAEPTVNDIDMIYFGGCDEDVLPLPQGTRLAYGVDNIVRYDPSVLSSGSPITETSQLAAVGAYENLLEVSWTDEYVQMTAGFAAEFFE